MQIETGLSAWVVDFDYASLYPSIMRALNTSRMTMTFVPFAIEGKSQLDVQLYFSNLIHIRENAVSLCSEFMALPTYEEMSQLVAARL